MCGVPHHPNSCHSIVYMSGSQQWLFKKRGFYPLPLCKGNSPAIRLLNSVLVIYLLQKPLARLQMPTWGLDHTVLISTSPSPASSSPHPSSSLEHPPNLPSARHTSPQPVCSVVICGASTGPGPAQAHAGLAPVLSLQNCLQMCLAQLSW